MNDFYLKPLPLSNWRETKITLHIFLQIVGKIRLALTPKRNHWWHVTFYLTAKGFTTSPIPYNNGLFEICFDFFKHEVSINTTQGDTVTIELTDLSVSNFYKKLFDALHDLNINIKILEKPFDPDKVGSHLPFSKDNQHIYKNTNAVTQFFYILSYIYPIFMEFSGSFNGKATPIHIFWHSFDLAYTRFSGKTGPSTKNMDPVSAEAYSHEVISFGFWAGDNNLPEPAFYSYTYPDPPNLRNEPLTPESAFWTEVNGGSMALLKYHDLLKEPDLKKSLLGFLNSAYTAGLKSAHWSF